MKFVTGLTCHLCGAHVSAEGARGSAASASVRSRCRYDYAAIRERDEPRADRVASAVAVALSGTAAGRGAEDRASTPASRRSCARRGWPRSLASPSSTSRTTRSTIRRSRTRTASSRWRPRAPSSSAFRCSAARRPAISPAASPRTPRASACRATSSSRTISSRPRFSAPRSTGRTVVAVEGNYDDVNRLCTQIADRYGWGFANINLRSYYAEGAKTMGFEIAEQLGWRYPDHIVSPVAGGTLLPRIYKGLREFKEVGPRRAATLPRIHAAQPAGSRAGRPRARGGPGVPGAGEAEHDRQVAGDRQSGRRLPGGQGRQGDRRQRRDGERRGDPRRHPAAGEHRRHLHRAGRRHDARGDARARSSAA